jgi:hypothetical protein
MRCRRSVLSMRRLDTFCTSRMLGTTGCRAFLSSEQEVLITVPASFDQVARELTVRAAQAAGLPKVTLLEEPQAAFYAWLGRHPRSWRDLLHVGDVVLVCDVGGGTTDFSLMSVADQAGQPDHRANCRRRSHPAWRRQHGPDAGDERRQAPRTRRPQARVLAASAAPAQLSLCQRRAARRRSQQGSRTGRGPWSWLEGDRRLGKDPAHPRRRRKVPARRLFSPGGVSGPAHGGAAHGSARDWPAVCVRSGGHAAPGEVSWRSSTYRRRCSSMAGS